MSDESGQDMKTILNTYNFDAHRIISIWFIEILIIWCDNSLNEMHIISHGDNWYFSDSNWICFQLKIHEMVIEMIMKMIQIILFSFDAIGVSYIIVSIFKFIFTLINLMAIISDINMWLWQWLKFIHVLLTMVIESMMRYLFIHLFLWSLHCYSITISCVCAICVMIGSVLVYYGL